MGPVSEGGDDHTSNRVLDRPFRPGCCHSPALILHALSDHPGAPIITRTPNSAIHCPHTIAQSLCPLNSPGDPPWVCRKPDAVPQTPTAKTGLTPTPDPQLPCGGVMPERVYLFLDCSDIRRIRAELASPSNDLEIAWRHLLQTVDDYREKFPTSYRSHGGGSPFVGTEQLHGEGHGAHLPRHRR